MENAPIIHEGDEEAREVALDNQEGLDNLSNGLSEGDPLLNEENEDPASSSDSSSERNEEFKQPDWEEVPNGWQPNWLGSYTQNPGIPQDFPQNISSVSDYFSLFFDHEVLDLVVNETNRYASQNFNRFPEKTSQEYYKDWQP